MSSTNVNKKVLRGDINNLPEEAVRTEDAFSFLKKSLTEKMGAISGQQNNVEYTVTLLSEEMQKKGEKTSSVYYFYLPYQIELVCGDKSFVLDMVYRGTSSVNKPKNISAVVSRIRRNVYAEGEEFVKSLVDPELILSSDFIVRDYNMEVLAFLHDISPHCDALETHMKGMDYHKASSFFHLAPHQLDLIKHVSKKWCDYSHDLEDGESYAVVFGNKRFIVWTLVDGVYTQNQGYKYRREMPVLEGPLFKQLDHQFKMAIKEALGNK